MLVGFLLLYEQKNLCAGAFAPFPYFPLDITQPLETPARQLADSYRNNLAADDTRVVHSLLANDFTCLRDREWLTSAIIDGYFQRLEHHFNATARDRSVHFFSCSTYTSLQRNLPLTP